MKNQYQSELVGGKSHGCTPPPIFLYSLCETLHRFCSKQCRKVYITRLETKVGIQINFTYESTLTMLIRTTSGIPLRGKTDPAIPSTTWILAAFDCLLLAVRSKQLKNSRLHKFFDSALWALIRMMDDYQICGVLVGRAAPAIGKVGGCLWPSK